MTASAQYTPRQEANNVDSRKTYSAPSQYAALLWDNDGVLVDTERWYFQATQAVFAQAGIDFTVEHYFEYFLARSHGTSAFALAQGLSEADIATMQADRNARYLQRLEHESITMNDVRETLARLRPYFVMGIVTSSRREHFEAIHRRTGLLEFFDFVVTHEDYPRSKPAPDPYLAAIARSGFPASKCLAIEDAPRGLIAAQAAQLDCWIIPTELTRRAAFSGATRVLDHIMDVPALLLEAN